MIANIKRLYPEEEWEALIAELGEREWFVGCIAEADYAQLEFRAAGQLSGDSQVIKDLQDHVDVHSVTSQILTEAGQPTNRQHAKPHTFKPLYGGLSGTTAEVAYYTAFLEKYSRIKQWHVELCNQAIATKRITLPTGRQYEFPNCKRNRHGSAVGATKIKNFPVQGFATADIVPLAVTLLWRSMKAHGVKSLIVNSVHDSIALDIFPGEERLIYRLCEDAMLHAMVDDLQVRYEIGTIVPLEIEIKSGPNWLDTKKVGVFAIGPTKDFTNALA